MSQQRKVERRKQCGHQLFDRSWITKSCFGLGEEDMMSHCHGHAHLFILYYWSWATKIHRNKDNKIQVLNVYQNILQHELDWIKGINEKYIHPFYSWPGTHIFNMRSNEHGTLKWLHQSMGNCLQLGPEWGTLQLMVLGCVIPIYKR